MAAGTMKKVSIELGGNAPYIMFDDADIDIAVASMLHASFAAVGRHVSLQTRYTCKAEFTMRVKKMREHIYDAVSKGAKLVVGSISLDLEAYLIEPALLTGVTSKMLVAREETFGPLAPVFKFDTEEDVIEQANDTEFGLASYIFSNDLRKIWRVANALEAGIVGVNTGVISACEAPFGGIKESGLGKEGSKYGLAEFQVIKNITLSLE
ncbi:hypothetical protein VF21_06802 [Pseudogymnoascus sp. 05NY08]|nr:hypothetical protein VF21_06802 [Pseudogymnoascus sp. 05NY08]